MQAGPGAAADQLILGEAAQDVYLVADELLFDGQGELVGRRVLRVVGGRGGASQPWRASGAIGPVPAGAMPRPTRLGQHESLGALFAVDSQGDGALVGGSRVHEHSCVGEVAEG